jgi:CRP/FNR family transcriptional regulator, cyclic AMP receptor protein
MWAQSAAWASLADVQKGTSVNEPRARAVQAALTPTERAPAVSPDVEFLRRGRWFGSLPAALQSIIVERAITRSYRKGAFIIDEGALPRGLFALLEGRVHVVRGIAESGQALVHVGEPGLWFGELGMLSGRPALASVVATANARTLLLPIADFQRIVADEPRYYPQFAALLFERFATVFRYASEARSVPAEDWLWTRLQDLAEIRRLDAQIQGPIDINVSQSELAAMVGVSRQTLCMLLGRLQGRGQIDVGYKRIRVL